MGKRLHHRQVESTLYMPSMYDTGDEDDSTDQRDEENPNERDQNVPRSPRFSLQRCLAWSQDDDHSEERVQGEEKEDDDDDDDEVDTTENDHDNHLHLFPEYSESSLSMVKSFGSYHSAVVDAASSIDFQINSMSNNWIRPVPVHWEEQVTVDKNLVSFLSTKKAVTTGRH
jgi:hypothetical protein